MILERRRANNTWLIFKECLPQAQDWSIIMSSKSGKGDRMPPRISKELLIKLKHKYINRQELRDQCGVRSKEGLLLIRRIRLGNTETNKVNRSSLALMGCTHKC